MTHNSWPLYACLDTRSPLFMSKPVTVDRFYKHPALCAFCRREIDHWEFNKYVLCLNSLCGVHISENTIKTKFKYTNNLFIISVTFEWSGVGESSHTILTTNNITNFSHQKHLTTN